MLSPVWSGELPVSAAMLRNKPLFCSDPVWKSFRLKKELEKLYQETGATVVVESECRYWPSILLARELQATKLGQPCKLFWQIPHQLGIDFDSRDEIISIMLDAVCFLLQRTHIKSGNPHGTQFLFDKHQNDENESVPVSIHLQKDKNLDNFLLRIQCERGSIDINSDTELNWESGEKSRQILLEEEQSAISRQIDHFCRHVSGGLIPLHDITNALWNDRQTMSIQKHLDD
jgi:predicted dehydrogenase